MNKRVMNTVLVLLWVGIVAVVLLCLHPPYIGRTKGLSGDRIWIPVGRMRLHQQQTPTHRPQGPTMSARVYPFRVNTDQLFLECLVVLLLDAGAIATVILLSKRLVGEKGRERGQ